jgi:hypothetical protein
MIGLEEHANGELDQALDVDPARHGLGVVFEQLVQPGVEPQIVKCLESL